jgi:hypothetical protein
MVVHPEIELHEPDVVVSSPDYGQDEEQIEERTREASGEKEPAIGFGTREKKNEKHRHDGEQINLMEEDAEGVEERKKQDKEKRAANPPVEEE